jgi:hypothetical protein
MPRSAESWAMPRDPYIRDKFTREHGEARRVAREYFAKYPKDRYQTEVESWRQLRPRSKAASVGGRAFSTISCRS